MCTAPQPSQLRTDHLTISTPLGLRRTVLPQLNVISASNNYLLLEKKFAEGRGANWRFVFQGPLDDFSISAWERNLQLPLKSMPFHRNRNGVSLQEESCFIVRCTTRFHIKEMAFLRHNLPQMVQNPPIFQIPTFSSCKIHAKFIILLYANQKFKKNTDFQVSVTSTILPGKTKMTFSL